MVTVAGMGRFFFLFFPLPLSLSFLTAVSSVSFTSSLRFGGLGGVSSPPPANHIILPEGEERSPGPLGTFILSCL